MFLAISPGEKVWFFARVLWLFYIIHVMLDMIVGDGELIFMGSPKITWEQFNEYKVKCRAILSELDEIGEKNKGNPKFNEKEFEAQLIQRYLAI